MPHISALTLYPIKSLAGFPVQKALAEERGLCFDRRYMLVDIDGRFLTQRELPFMSQISFSSPTQQMWTLHAPGYPTFQLAQKPHLGTPTPVTLWNDAFSAHHVSLEADQWFSQVLGHPVRLIFMDESDIRQIEPREGVRKGTTVSFADGYPILLISEESLETLNAKLQFPVPMNRFRPNLVVKGVLPFEEDEWTEVAMGSAIFGVVKPCKRCVMTTIEQETSTANELQEPMRTLSQFRKGKSGVYFGQNLVVLRPGIVEIGQEVQVLSRKKDLASVKNW